MLYYNIAMIIIAIYFIFRFFRFSRTIEENDEGGKVVINKIEILRRPSMLHAFTFGFFTFVIYWLFA